MALLLCTSAWEGYPNTFMEAWMRNMPTVSTVDPDQVVAKNGLGGISETVEGLRHAIVALVESKSHWQACGRRAREFVVRNHGVAGAGDAYEQVIDDVLGRRVDQPDGMNVVYTEGG
jgi:glycosyltransferase involved in cell wall biosynthesis